MLQQQYEKNTETSDGVFGNEIEDKQKDFEKRKDR